MKYTSIQKIEDLLCHIIDAGFYDAVENWVNSAEKYIDNFTRTNFKAEQGDYYYDGNGKNRLFIDDFTKIDSVEVSGAVINFEEYPKRKPHYAIIADYFNKGYQNVKVIGKRGYSDEPPADIQMAATILAVGIINTQIKTDSIKQERLDDYTISYKDDKQVAQYETAMATLKSYQKQL